MDKPGLADEPSSSAVVSHSSNDDPPPETSSWKSLFRRPASKKSTSAYKPMGDERKIDPSSLRPKGDEGASPSGPVVVQGTNGITIETEDSQLLKRGGERQLTNVQAVLHLFKIFTGPSTVGMPAIVKNGGILFGTVGFIITGFLNTYASITICKCGRILCRRTGVSALRYHELMEMCVISYSDTTRGRRVAKIMRTITVIMLWMTQFGILALYIQIVGDIFDSQLRNVWPGYPLPLVFSQLVITLCLIPYSMMTNLKILSWFSLLANVFIGICVVTILQYSFSNLESPSRLPLINDDPIKIMLFLGAAVFTVEGVPMVLPIENRVKYPEDFGGCCGVITVAASMNIFVNIIVGFFGYIALGQDVPANILLALPKFWWYRVISILYALMVFLTYTLQLFLPAEFVVNAVHRKFKGERMKKYGFVPVRISINILAFVFAALIPNIQLVMALTGASSSVTLLFILPPICELLLQSGEPEGITWSVWTRSILVLIFGAVVLTSGTYAALQTIVEKWIS